MANFTKSGTVLVLLLTALAARAPASPVAWPEMRGPFQDGHVQKDGAKPLGLPIHWSETQNVVWKTLIPHRGWSTPVVMNGQVWLTTAAEWGNDFYVLCVDAETGKIIVNKKLFHSVNPEPLGNNVNSYATPSPVIEPGRVYVHFGSYGTACLDTKNAAVLWQRTDLPCRHFRGPSSSPILWNKFLVVTMDGVDLHYTVALDKMTGKTVWKTDRSVNYGDYDSPNEMVRMGDQRKAHSTPIVVTNKNLPLLLSAGAKAFYGYDPRDGKELWRVENQDYSVAPRPLFHDGIAYFISGTGRSELYAISADGHGDVSDSKVIWHHRTHNGRFSSPILVDGFFYDASEESFISCIDAANGTTIWNERIGGTYEGSPIYGDGYLYYFNTSGDGTVLKPGRTCDVVAKNRLDEGMMCCPSVAGKALYIRTKAALYRIEQK